MRASCRTWPSRRLLRIRRHDEWIESQQRVFRQQQGHRILHMAAFGIHAATPYGVVVLRVWRRIDHAAGDGSAGEVVNGNLLGRVQRGDVPDDGVAILARCHQFIAAFAAAARVAGRVDHEDIFAQILLCHCLTDIDRYQYINCCHGFTPLWNGIKHYNYPLCDEIMKTQSKYRQRFRAIGLHHWRIKIREMYQLKIRRIYQ